MKFRKLYESVVAQGIEADPRGKKAVLKILKKKNDSYKGMKKEDKEFFDVESLTNPYADTRMLHGTGDEEIKTVIVGIDMEIGELLLADRLTEKGQKVDLVIAHHPEGKAYANFYEVMHMQADILSKHGVPINIAEDLLEGRIKEVERRLMPANHSRAVDAAKLLDIPFMCMHTPTDNMVATYLQKLIDRKKPDTLDDILKILLDIPEYHKAAQNNAGPKILRGRKIYRKKSNLFNKSNGFENVSRKSTKDRRITSSNYPSILSK